MEFKNLAEVTQLDEVPEGASVLAATADGEVVRVPGDGLGGGGGNDVVFYINEDDAASCNMSFAKAVEAYDANANFRVIDLDTSKIGMLGAYMTVAYAAVDADNAALMPGNTGSAAKIGVMVASVTTGGQFTLVYDADGTITVS